MILDSNVKIPSSVRYTFLGPKAAYFNALDNPALQHNYISLCSVDGNPTGFIKTTLFGPHCVYDTPEKAWVAYNEVLKDYVNTFYFTSMMIIWRHLPELIIIPEDNEDGKKLYTVRSRLVVINC